MKYNYKIASSDVRGLSHIKNNVACQDKTICKLSKISKKDKVSISVILPPGTKTHLASWKKANNFLNDKELKI